jgi:tagatose 1,6-diphosphate aldolase
VQTGEGALLDACRALDAASARPWVILSAGAEYSVFRRQVELACRTGGSGFLAGRALWQEAVGMTDKTERLKFLNEVSAGRLKELTGIVERCGRPWYKKLGLDAENLVSVAPDWYREY